MNSAQQIIETVRAEQEKATAEKAEVKPSETPKLPIIQWFDAMLKSEHPDTIPENITNEMQRYITLALAEYGKTYGHNEQNITQIVSNAFDARGWHVYLPIGFKQTRDEDIAKEYKFTDLQGGDYTYTISKDLNFKMFAPCTIKKEKNVITEIIPYSTELSREKIIKSLNPFFENKTPDVEGKVKKILETGTMFVSTLKGDVVIFNPKLIEDMELKLGQIVKIFGDMRQNGGKQSCKAYIIIPIPDKTIDDLALDDVKKAHIKQFITERADADASYAKIEYMILAAIGDSTNPDIDSILGQVHESVINIKEHAEKCRPVTHLLCEGINIVAKSRNGKHDISIENIKPPLESQPIDSKKSDWVLNPSKFKKISKEIIKLRPELNTVDLEGKIRTFAAKVLAKWPVTDDGTKKDSDNKEEESKYIQHRMKILEIQKVEIITIPGGIAFDKRPMFIFVPETGCWLNTARDHIQRYCASIPELDTLSDLKNLINNIQGETSHIIDGKNFHPRENFINMKNGYIDLDTMEFHDGHGDECKQYYFMAMLRIDYNTQAPAPQNFLDILQLALPDKKDQDLLQEIYGLAISDILPKKFYIIIGTTNTFKSTLIRILELGLIGTEYSANNDIDDLTTSKDAQLNIANLVGKKLNVNYDMKRQKLKIVGPLKSLASGGTDPTRGRKHYEDPNSLISTAKMIFIGNDYPETSPEVDEDEAFWKRVVCLEFKNKVILPPGKVLEEDFRTVFAKYYEPELPGILNWALEGLKRYMERNGKHSFDGDPFSMFHAQKGIEKPFEYFIDKYFDTEIQGVIRQTPTELVRELCKIYCNEMREEIPSEDSLGRHISNLHLGIMKRESRLFDPLIHRKIKVYDGIVPKEEYLKLVCLTNPEMYNKYIKYYEDYYRSVSYSLPSPKPIIINL